MDTSQQASRPAQLGTAEIINRLSRFDGPPEHFLVNLLEAQCHLASAAGGAILRCAADGRAEVLAVYPSIAPDATPPVWLAQVVESAGQVIASRTTAVKPLHKPEDLYGQPAKSHLVMLPLRSSQAIHGLAGFVVEASDQAALDASRERLELSISLLSLYEMRLTLQQRQGAMTRLKMAMETLAAVNDQNRFAGAAMAFCNEIAARWQCERVSLGFLKGRYVQLRAMSHTEKFSRKMKLIQDIESAMEECLDQDVEVLHPPAEQATYVSRAAGDLSKRHGPVALLSLPLRRDGEVTAVLTAERPLDKTFTLEEVESLRLACELCTARLDNLQQHDRWFGAKLASGIRKGLSFVVGAKHTWAKLAAILILGAILFLSFAKGTYRVEAPFVLEATQRQVIPAPFDGYLENVNVEPGNSVEKDKTILASLRTDELGLKLTEAQAQKLRYEKEASRAMRDGETAEAQIAQAQAKEAQAQINLLEHYISQAQITSPISGLVLTGDLKKQVGGPVEKGKVLFEVAPLESLRAQLSVPEDRIADVQIDQKGELATASDPGKRIKFEVERINPIAEVVEQRNVFKVRVRLLQMDAQTKERIKPGLEGVAKITIPGKRTYAWLWTHRMVDWLRMKLWI